MSLVSPGRRWLKATFKSDDERKREEMRSDVQRLSLRLGPNGGTLQGMVWGVDGYTATAADVQRFCRALAYCDLHPVGPLSFECDIGFADEPAGIVSVEVVRGTGWCGGELSLCEHGLEGALS